MIVIIIIIILDINMCNVEGQDIKVKSDKVNATCTFTWIHTLKKGDSFISSDWSHDLSNAFFPHVTLSNISLYGRHPKELLKGWLP